MKTFKIIILSVIGIVIGMNLFSKVFPDAYESLVNIDKILEYSTTVITGYNISRFGAFKEINSLFFNNDLFLNLFGYGFGNCEYSSLEIFTSDFYNQYGYLHYRWFAHQMWFLETGYLGFGLYLVFFVCIFIWGFKNKKYLKGYQEYALLSQVFSVLMVISLWYDASSRVEIGYVMFLTLAAPLVVLKTVRRNQYEII